MATFDALIDDLATRYGLGANARPLIAEVLGMIANTPAGLSGFLDTLRSAGLTPEVASWLGNPGAGPIAAGQVKRALGATVLGGIAGRLGVAQGPVWTALEYALPKIIGLLTPGGAVPAGTPAEVTAFLYQSRATAAMEAASRRTDVYAESGRGESGVRRWLWPALAALVVVCLLSYFWSTLNRIPSTPPVAKAPEPATPAPEIVAQAPSPPPTPSPAAQPPAAPPSEPTAAPQPAAHSSAPATSTEAQATAPPPPAPAPSTDAQATAPPPPAPAPPTDTQATPPPPPAPAPPTDAQATPPPPPTPAPPTDAQATPPPPPAPAPPTDAQATAPPPPAPAPSTDAQATPPAAAQAPVANSTSHPTAEQSLASPAPAAVAAAEPTAPASGGQPTRLALSNDGGVVRASGVVPDQDAKTSILDALNSVFGADKVKSDISIDQSAAAASWLGSFRAALEALQGADVDAIFDGDKVNVGGAAMGDAARDKIIAALKSALGASVEVGALTDQTAAAIAIANDRATTELASLQSGFAVKDLLFALNDSVVNFASDSAEVPESMAPFLKSAAADLKQLKAGHVLEIAGYTDSTGDAALNVALSQKRAEAVREALIRYGADPDMLVAKGYGEANPIARNDTVEGRLKNRRIEYHVVKAPA